MTEPSPQPEPEEAAESEGRRAIPPPSRWASAMDELIEEAMKRGDFDNLPGRGRPLDLQRNPYAAGYELAYELLKNNDYTLPWIAGRNAVLAEVESLIAELGQAWRQHAAEFARTASELAAASLAASWSRHLVELQARLPEVNRRIEAVNLKQPAAQFEIVKLTVDSALARAGAVRALVRSPR